MKTPMQQHMEWLHKKYISHLQDEETGLALEVWYCLKNAEQMLEKERRAIVSAFAWGNITKVQYKGQHIAGEDYYNDRYNETFNTKEK